jgi:hypothetical protein
LLPNSNIENETAKGRQSIDGQTWIDMVRTWSATGHDVEATSVCRLSMKILML